LKQEEQIIPEEKPINKPAKILALIFGISNAMILGLMMLGFVLFEALFIAMYGESGYIIYFTNCLYLISLLIFCFYKIVPKKQFFEIAMLYFSGLVLNLMALVFNLSLANFSFSLG
jgi:hypothetical protein